MFKDMKVYIILGLRHPPAPTKYDSMAYLIDLYCQVKNGQFDPCNHTLENNLSPPIECSD